MLRCILTTTTFALVALSHAASTAQASRPIDGTWTKSFHLDGGQHKKIEVTLKKSTDYSIRLTGDQPAELRVLRFWNNDLKDEYGDSGYGTYRKVSFTSTHHGDRPYVINVKNHGEHRGQFTLTITSGGGFDPPPPSADPPPTSQRKWELGATLRETSSGLYVDRYEFRSPAFGVFQTGEYITHVAAPVSTTPGFGGGGQFFPVRSVGALHRHFNRLAGTRGQIRLRVLDPEGKTRTVSLNLRPASEAIPAF